jgi:uncharacterized lipoprotein YmbA
MTRQIRFSSWIGSLALTLSLAACSSVQTPRFHSLLVGESPPAPTASPPGPSTPLAIDLPVVGVPAMVDQPQWVVRLADGSLRVLESERWASPLRDELRSALMARWAMRLGAIDARSAPAGIAVRVRVDVDRFESTAGREAWLQATWSVSAQGRDSVGPCVSRFVESTGPGIDALVAGHRRATTRLADDIGTSLDAVRFGQPARCP